MLGYLLALVIGGAIIGALARFALPGPDPMGCGATILVGIGGSLIAGVIVRLIWGPRYEAGFLLSVLCATALVYLIRRYQRGRPVA